MDRPDVGQTFTTKIDRVSSSGNGIIEFEEGAINIGPIKRSAVGEEVKIEVIAPNFGKCLDENVRRGNYRKKLNTMKSFSPGPTYDPDGWGKEITHNDSSPEKNEPDWISIGDVVSVKIDDTNIAGVPVGKYGDREIHIPGASLNNTVEVEITKVGTSFAVGKQVEGTSGSDILSTQTQKDSSKGEAKTSLSQLREQAEEAAIEEVPEGASTTPHTAPQYTRSQTVREYVLARANGYCEGCGGLAPFRSKTGEPYLHAHHIHELSDGGSDTPDTVVALCPNCHYRVHHGEDGNEYNEELLEEVQEIEG